MPYTAFTIYPDKKEKGVLRIWANSTSAGGWVGGGCFLDLYPVSGYIVALHGLSQKPIAVFKDIDNCIAFLEEKYGITAVQQNYPPEF